MDNTATMRKAYDRINAGDLPSFIDLLADDFVEHEEVPGIPPTKQGVLEYFGMLLSAFPDMRAEVEDLFGSGDKRVARVKMIGTHLGEFMGIPPTERRVEMKFIDIMRFNSAGLVCEHWGVADQLSLMQQLGVVPAEPPA